MLTTLDLAQMIELPSQPLTRTVYFTLTRPFSSLNHKIIGCIMVPFQTKHYCSKCKELRNQTINFIRNSKNVWSTWSGMSCNNKHKIIHIRTLGREVELKSISPWRHSLRIHTSSWKRGNVQQKSALQKVSANEAEKHIAMIRVLLKST